MPAVISKLARVYRALLGGPLESVIAVGKWGLLRNDLFGLRTEDTETEIWNH